MKLCQLDPAELQQRNLHPHRWAVGEDNHWESEEEETK